MPHGCLRQHPNAQCSLCVWINLRIVLVLSPFPTPATIRPTIICGMPYEVAWSTAPIERITEPAMIHHRRPSRSPTRRDMIAPKKQPCLLSVCADAWIRYEQSHRWQPWLHGQSRLLQPSRACGGEHTLSPATRSSHVLPRSCQSQEIPGQKHRRSKDPT